MSISREQRGHLPSKKTSTSKSLVDVASMYEMLRRT
jgi:hypothetical protein